MKSRRFSPLVPLFVLALIGAPMAIVTMAQTAAPAAQTSAAAPSLSQKLPFDAAVTRGTLPNGLEYYIRRNTRPEKRVALRLARPGLLLAAAAVARPGLGLSAAASAASRGAPVDPPALGASVLATPLLLGLCHGERG